LVLHGSNSPEKVSSVTLDKRLRLNRKNRTDMNAVGEEEQFLPRPGVELRFLCLAVRRPVRYSLSPF
jgi:hypothetical protein